MFPLRGGLAGEISLISREHAIDVSSKSYDVCHDTDRIDRPNRFQPRNCYRILLGHYLRFATLFAVYLQVACDAVGRVELSIFVKVGVEHLFN